jgi:cytochrome c553
MSIGRTILVLVMALSVAVLPAVGGEPHSVKSDMALSQTMSLCCECHGAPCDTAKKDTPVVDGCHQREFCGRACAMQ